MAPDWSAGNIDIHDNGFTLRGNSRLYFASSCEDGWNNGMYAQVNNMIQLDTKSKYVQLSI